MQIIGILLQTYLCSNILFVHENSAVAIKRKEIVQSAKVLAKNFGIILYFLWESDSLIKDYEWIFWTSLIQNLERK